MRLRAQAAGSAPFFSTIRAAEAFLYKTIILQIMKLLSRILISASSLLALASCDAMWDTSVDVPLGYGGSLGIGVTTPVYSPWSGYWPGAYNWNSGWWPGPAYVPVVRVPWSIVLPCVRERESLLRRATGVRPAIPVRCVRPCRSPCSHGSANRGGGAARAPDRRQ